MSSPRGQKSDTVHLARATMSAVRTHSVTHAPPTDGQHLYRPYGKARELLYSHDPEVVMVGPAGTGKTRACLEKLYICASKYAGMRALIVRKSREALTQSAMVTWETKVLPARTVVYFHTTYQEYRFPNGSVIVVGGLDKPQKVMSAEYDIIYVVEATELTEEDWESLTTRLRNGVMPYQQMIGDSNPGAPHHWLKKRAERGVLNMLESRHEDNPTVTAQYLAQLDKLTGVRYLRLRKGLWAAAEGLVYPEYDPAVHVVDRYDADGASIIKPGWRRYRSIDFGYTNPFCCQWWAEDPDGRLYLYRELYGTQRIVSDWAREIKELSAGESITLTVSDHDAEDRATLHSCGIQTVAATKDVSPGIQAVEGRLRPAGDGRPRLFVLSDSLVRRDSALDEAKKPASTLEEFESYIWQKARDGKPLKEEPHKEHDHGMDCLRYMAMALEKPAPRPPLGRAYAPRPINTPNPHIGRRY